MNAPEVGVGPSGGATLPRPNRLRPKKILKGLVVLIFGMVIGSALTAHFGHRMMMRFLGDPDKMSERLHHRLDHDLDLTPAQSEKIGPIISQHTHRIIGILREAKPRVTEQADQMHLEIRQELNPEQAEKWDRIHERMKNHLPPPFGPMSGPESKSDN